MAKRRNRGRLRPLREASASATAGALERGELADFEGAEDTDEMAEDGGGQTCPTCDGEGTIRGGQTCPDCKGSGKVADDGDDDMKEAAIAQMLERDFSSDERKAAAKSGTALPDGSFPIKSKADLGNAVQAHGRASDKAAAKAHIIKRAKALGATDALPDDWSKSKESEGMEARLAALEEELHAQRSIREAKPDHLNQVFGPTTRAKNSRGEEGYEVTLIREGNGNENDGAYYPRDALKELAESGRAEGMQAYANHPTLEEEESRPERDVRELIGTHTDVRYVEESGVPKVKSIFVPITTDARHPHYGWVNTLAEAAARNQGPQPLVGWSLYGLSAGDEGERPDGSEGRIVSLVMPTSGDMVTNAGAGGEFARRLMMESARRLRRAHHTNRKEQPTMKIGEFRIKLAEALKDLREASTDEDRQAAESEVERLQGEAAKIDAPPQAPDSVEALTEAAPALVEKLREAAQAEGATEVERLKAELATKDGKLKEAEQFITGITDVRRIADVLREADVTDPTELRYFASQAQARKLSDAADIKDMVETERSYHKAQEESMLSKLREAVDLPEVEGVLLRRPEPATDGDESFLREAGIPLTDAA